MLKCSEKYTFLTSTIMYNCRGRLCDMIESYWKVFYSILSRGYSVLHQWVNAVKVVRNHSKRLLIRFMQHKNTPLYPLNLLTQLLQSAWSKSSSYDCCNLLDSCLSQELSLEYSRYTPVKNYSHHFYLSYYYFRRYFKDFTLLQHAAAFSRKFTQCKWTVPLSFFRVSMADLWLILKYIF